MIPLWFVLLVAALFGLAVGSFLNVAAWRIPQGLSVSHPRSFCPRCTHAIRSRDNIPVLSWLWLRGRCRDCQVPISARYPLMETACSGLVVAQFAVLGAHIQTLAYAVLAAVLLLLATIDIHHMRLPTRLVYSGLASQILILSAASAYYGQWQRVVWALLSAVWVSGLLLLLRWGSRGGMGLGDVRMALLCGASSGWLGLGVPLVGLLIAAASGALWGLGLFAAKRADRRSKIAFGPFLALGTEIAILLGPHIVHWWTGTPLGG